MPLSYGIGGGGGGPVASYSEVQPGNLLVSGVGTVARTDVASSATMTSQLVRFSYFTARRSFTSTQSTSYVTTTAAAATPTLCRWGLYSVAANGDLTLIASIANDTTLWAVQQTAYTRSWTTPVDIHQGTRYALGLLCVTGAAAPTLASANNITNPIASAEPRLCAQLAGQTDLPSSVLSASLGQVATTVYVAITP
jgi:hypothetical protein